MIVDTQVFQEASCNTLVLHYIPICLNYLWYYIVCVAKIYLNLNLNLTSDSWLINLKRPSTDAKWLFTFRFFHWFFWARIKCKCLRFYNKKARPTVKILTRSTPWSNFDLLNSSFAKNHYATLPEARLLGLYLVKRTRLLSTFISDRRNVLRTKPGDPKQYIVNQALLCTPRTHGSVASNKLLTRVARAGPKLLWLELLGLRLYRETSTPRARL